MVTKIQLRRDTEANWDTNNPVLAEGEIGISTDKRNFKIGDGTSDWKTINYALVPLGTKGTDGVNDIVIGNNAASNKDSMSIGNGATSDYTGMSIGNGAESMSSMSIGRNAQSLNSGLAIGSAAKSTNGVAIGWNTECDYFGIALGNNTKSETNGINIGARGITVPEKTIQIGTDTHTILKIPALAGANQGMTLKVSTDGTIYAD